MRSPLTVMTQLLFIVILSIGAMYSFSSSLVFPHLLDLISRVYPLQPQYLSLILGALLILFGLVFVTIKKPPRIGLFIGLVAVFSANSLLAFSSAAIGWLRVWSAERFLETQMTFTEVFCLAMTIIIAYMALRYTTWFDDSRTEMISRGGDLTEIEEAYKNEHLWASLVLVGAVLIAILVSLLAREMKNLVGEHTGGIQLKLVVIGIGCSLVIIGAVYTLATRGRASTIETSKEEV